MISQGREKMGELDQESYDKLAELIKAGDIKLESLREMTYDDLEVLCNQLLKWKLFIANKEYVGEAIEQYMTNSLN
jgi:hypothetical protein